MKGSAWQCGTRPSWSTFIMRGQNHPGGIWDFWRWERFGEKWRPSLSWGV